MGYRIVFKHALNAKDKTRPGVVIYADGYLVKDGELTTQLDERGRIVYKSGVKITSNVKLATVFDTTTEAVKYQSLVGVRGRRGQLVRVD